MKKTHIGRRLLILLLVSTCVLSFGSSKSEKEITAKSASAKSAYLDPEDMVQGGYYFFWDHGSGAMVAQFDRYENGTIYNTYSITPQQSLFTQNGSCTVYDAGLIQLAGLGDILHLLRCILAGVFVP
jgi:hypothetical protein